MWRTVFTTGFTSNRIQRSSSTSSSMDLLNEKSLVNGLNYSLDRTKLNSGDNEQQQQQFCKKKNSSLRIRKREEKCTVRKQQFENHQLEEQDILSIKSSLIESKKKLTKNLSIKFRQASSSNDKIKRRTYEHFECAVILNDCNKMSILLKDNPKSNLSHCLRPDGNSLLHTAVRYQCKDALSWLASRYTKITIESSKRKLRITIAYSSARAITNTS